MLGRNDAYNLKDPNYNEFKFAKFSAFCDAITLGAAPFEKIDQNSEGGRDYIEWISKTYKDKCKMLRTPKKLFLNLRDGNVEDREFDMIAL